MNHLAREKSPYLRQHAENPVDWFPWGEEAFTKARAEQKPIFLSIGYSTCHWCHVMARESFENPDVAALLNQHFIPIKVDREERPDVDRVYMTYVQALTGHGGWPLSAWLTPELQPFYGGTYFPPEDQPGRMGFSGVLRVLVRAWTDDREKVVAEGARVVEELRAYAARAEQGSKEQGAMPLATAVREAWSSAFQEFRETFDARHGGFGGAPKFPRASTLNFLFRCAARQGVDSEVGREAVRLCVATLRGMARGGLHDHVGGGYHRYSVDAEWFVPHFEKMLYDQAQIAVNFLEAHQVTGDARHAWAARDIFEYVLRDLAHPSGGFFSAEDADSPLAPSSAEHAEGAFYLWTADELRTELGEDFDLFARHFGVVEAGNVPAERDPSGEFFEKNLLVQSQPLAETARLAGLSLETASEKIAAGLARLRTARNRRPRPHCDDKILTAWNGLMISALAQGAAATAEPLADQQAAYRDAAARAAEFLRRELFDESRGMLFRAWREGRGATEGFAEDYAFLIQGLLDLYEASFDVRWLQWAERLQEKMDELFFDGAAGGYFDSPASETRLILRLKGDYDGAEPAANSVAAMNLFRLAAMRQRDDFRERALRTLTAFRTQWAGAPYALPQMLCALEPALELPGQIVFAGEPQSESFRALVAVAHERLGTRRVLLCADGGAGQSWLAERAPEIAAMRPVGGRATAYVCENFVCREPVQDAAALRAMLHEARR